MLVQDLHIRTALKRIPVASDVDRVTNLIGKRVSVANGQYVGKVVGHNASPFGAFPGRFYPVNVLLDVDHRGHINRTHSFKLEDVKVIE